MKDRLMLWIGRLLIRYGLIKHPYGRQYVKDNITLYGTWK